jgi:type II secretory pathway component PulF
MAEDFSGLEILLKAASKAQVGEVCDQIYLHKDNGTSMIDSLRYLMQSVYLPRFYVGVVDFVEEEFVVASIKLSLTA